MTDRLKPDNKVELGRSIHTPVHPLRAAAKEEQFQDFGRDIEDRNYELMAEFRGRRASAQRISSAASGDVVPAIPRFYEPSDYWETSSLPHDPQITQHREKLYTWLELIYKTHHLIPILVDIFTRFPLVGMDFKSPDKKLTQFYEDVFFDQLDYEQFLVDLGREYWLFGQSFPCGSFNENLGVWEREELIDPLAVEIQTVPILGKSQYFLRPLPELIELVKRKEPRDLYHKLETEFPEMIPYLRDKKHMPISDVLLKQVAYKVSPRDTHGTPLLLRGLRTIIHEEKLLASQDAIAERLYAPLILAKLGIPDLGNDQGPWIPSPAEMEFFRNDLDYALASDFRLIVHHFGVEIQNVFGREQMPRLDQDFDRIDMKFMRLFGVNPALLSGGQNAQPYASSALQAEFLTQILRTFQRYLKRHYESRAYIVAEAQEHYAYEKRGEERIPIKQEVVEYDEDGEMVIVEKNKLLIPELKMKVLDLRDEATQRQFLFELKQAGVPIPDQDIAIGFDYDFEESLAKFEEELVQKTVTQQEAKVKSYEILLARGLPIPSDLRAEMEGMAAGQAGPGQEPGLGLSVPGGDSIVMPPPPGSGGPTVPGGPPPIGPRNPQRGQVPEESHERTPIQPGVQIGRPGPPATVGPPGGAGGPGGMGFASEDEEQTPVLKRERLPRSREFDQVKEGLVTPDGTDESGDDEESSPSA